MNNLFTYVKLSKYTLISAAAFWAIAAALRHFDVSFSTLVFDIAIVLTVFGIFIYLTKVRGKSVV